ncbi:hypothetical protein PV08_11194 [Exophiala spinifera]|uniref:SMP-30/Gluconolactonase/LRE-like region domain-containing protein n=1 Tax=Exophiala spinifera TaxID=91928 RepID=A0A0D2AU11_9EURO|nr:uncharacterized protein PV08_11194 [Exophiala spinifera]KIW10233.1 hypothetical protein PV08_11194 [Exophiala spinifera]
MDPQTEPRFIQHHPSFSKIVGRDARYQLLCESQFPLFHEACIFDPRDNSVFVTSNQLHNDAGHDSADTDNKHVKLTCIRDTVGGEAVVQEISFPGSDHAMLNGGVNFGHGTILLCAQGSKNPSDISGIISLGIPPPGYGAPPRVVVDSFHGIPFNSVNDVVVSPTDGSIWFTDPSYGHGQGIRRAPQLPNQVYRYDPHTKTIRAVADGFVRPNGLCFSPDLRTLYVTDTGAIHGSPDVPIDLSGPSHIYAFDVVHVASDDSDSESSSKEPFLANKRLFAYAPGRFPDGIKCDTAGNVYAGCGDGVEVWNKAGVQIGTMAIPGGVANFCFGRQGVIYACNETRLWKIFLEADTVKGALLGI